MRAERKEKKKKGRLEKILDGIKKIVKVFQEIREILSNGKEQKNITGTSGSGNTTVNLNAPVFGPISIGGGNITEIKSSEIKQFYVPIEKAVSITTKSNCDAPDDCLWLEEFDDAGKKSISAGKFFTYTKDKKTLHFWIGFIEYIGSDDTSGLYVWVLKKECPPAERMRQQGYTVQNGRMSEYNLPVPECMGNMANDDLSGALVKFLKKYLTDMFYE
jgi:hypothetical protein